MINTTLHHQSVEAWFHFYKHHTKQNYIFDGKSGLHLKQLIKKIRVKIIEKGLQDSDEQVLNSFKMFLNSIRDQWILEHLEISLVNSKFNVLYSHAIKHSPLGIKSSISSIIEQRYGSNDDSQQRGSQQC